MDEKRCSQCAFVDDMGEELVCCNLESDAYATYVFEDQSCDEFMQKEDEE